MFSLCPQVQLARRLLSVALQLCLDSPDLCQALRLPLMAASGMGTSPLHLFILCQAAGQPELRAGWKGVITHPRWGQGFEEVVCEVHELFLLETSGVPCIYLSEAMPTCTQQCPALATGGQLAQLVHLSQISDKQLGMPLINKKWGNELIIL